MVGSASLVNVAETIRIAVAPVFLLTGLAALLGVITGRLSRVIDRARALGASSDTRFLRMSELSCASSRAGSGLSTGRSSSQRCQP